MKKLIIILFTSVLLFAQETDKSQGIELPEFVITGVQAVEMPTLKKVKPEYVSTLSNEFFNPGFSPENFKLSEFSEPPKVDVDIFTGIQNKNAVLSVSGGLYNMPAGRFNAGFIYEGIFSGITVWGNNDLEHVDNSGALSFGANLLAEYNFGADEFLSEANLKFEGGFSNYDFKLYGSDNPEQQRENSELSLCASLNNYKTKGFDYKIGSQFVTTSLKDYSGIGYTETNFYNNLFLRYKMSVVSFVLDVYPRYVSIDNETTSKSKLHFKNILKAEVATSSSFNLELGLFTSNFDEFYLAPHLGVMVKPSKTLSLALQFSADDEVITNAKLEESNKFITLSQANMLYERKSTVASFLADYEFSRYFEISAGVKYSVYDTAYYYSANANNLFETNGIIEAQRIQVLLDAQFHLGPMGMLYANFTYDKFDKDDKQLPYKPIWYGSAIYSFEFLKGINLGAKLFLYSEVYTDLANTNSLDMMFTPGVFAEYKFMKDLTLKGEINNLFNAENFYYPGYQLKPLDILGSVEYRL